MSKRNVLSPLKQWENLTLADNFIFCKVMETDLGICKELLEMLLGIKIERIEQSSMERTIKTGLDSKGIRLDVYVKDNEERCFDIEIQTSTAQSLALAKRARYYQGLIDVDNLFSGADYKTLNETFVIFLCLGDAFGYGLPVYTFQNICTENGDIKLNDGTQKIFFNAKMYDKMESEELKSFFKYLCGKPSASDFTDKISAIVNRIKTSSEWRRDYMHFGVIMQDMIDEQVKILVEERVEERAQELAEERAQEMAEDRAKEMVQEAYKEWANERAVESAQKFLVMGILPEQVAEGTGLSLEQVKSLQTKLKP